jgi:hypothetical protein
MSHVADVAVLIKSQNIALDGAQIKSTLLSSVDKKTNQDGRVLTVDVSTPRAIGQSLMASLDSCRPAAACGRSSAAPSVR